MSTSNTGPALKININHLSGRSTCEKPDIKHVGVCGSSANFPQNFFRKITQNKETKMTHRSIVNLKCCIQDG
ncbi:hypothetical protein RCL_jg18581.t1 [Rhizophagus clarus]|uniref:Uncharacterized protein n=1 Tax=Rhizophagus clarus TaxID=94130 RepID=A0A8H3LJ95_9GLOM|nr:hypothetical protein RCL_jg18581.t1 [Rhizophagus clarus]